MTLDHLFNALIIIIIIFFIIIIIFIFIVYYHHICISIFIIYDMYIIYIYTYSFEDPKFFALACHDALQGVVLHVCQLERRAWEPQEVTILSSKS